MRLFNRRSSWVGRCLTLAGALIAVSLFLAATAGGFDNVREMEVFSGYYTPFNISSDGSHLAYTHVEDPYSGGEETVIKNLADGTEILRLDFYKFRYSDADFSDGGRYLAFGYDWGEFSPEDVSWHNDILVLDTLTGAIECVSTDSSGNQADRYSGEPSISADGRFVAFTSSAGNLVPGDTNDREDVFLKDTLTGETRLVSATADGQGGTGAVHGWQGASRPNVSADGRFVAFESEFTNLVPGDTNGVTDVFVKDINTGDILRASTGSAGNQADQPCRMARVSDDGRFAVFATSADGLVPDDHDGRYDIFRKDLLTGATALASSVDNLYVGAKAYISSDGRLVFFTVPDSIFVKDMQNDVLEEVQPLDYGVVFSTDYSASADGCRIYFTGMKIDTFEHVALMSAETTACAVQPPKEPADLLQHFEAYGGTISGPGKSMTAKLENAQASLDSGKTSVAINKMEAFVREVEAQRGKSLSEAEADLLVSEALAVIDAMNQ